MPIITPAYPSMCATHNVTRSTKQIVYKELVRGGEITDKIVSGKGQWKDLFVKHTFFTDSYKYYLSVVSASTTKEAQLIWSGYVESKIRILVGSLDEHESIAIAHPYNKGFERVHKCRNADEIEKVQRGSIEYQLKDVPTETTDLSSDNVGTKPGTATKSEATIGDTKEVAQLKDLVIDKDVGVDEETPVIIYSTTFYVGLELREGEYLSRSEGLVGLCFWQSNKVYRILESFPRC